MIVPVENEHELLDGIKEYFAAADELSLAMLDGKNIACKSGCSFCCHLHVTVKPYELLPLVKFVETLDHDERMGVEKILKSNRELLAAVSDEDLLGVNFTCPFLKSNSCSVYESRPMSCRAAHSRSKLVCEQAYYNPEDEIEADHLPDFTEAIRALEDEFEEAVGEYYDVSDYNITEALFEALADPKWITRFLEGEEVFSDHALSRV